MATNKQRPIEAFTRPSRPPVTTTRAARRRYRRAFRAMIRRMELDAQRPVGAAVRRSIIKSQWLCNVSRRGFYRRDQTVLREQTNIGRGAARRRTRAVEA